LVAEEALESGTDLAEGALQVRSFVLPRRPNALRGGP
jgi:hypothetical protein